MDIMRMEITTHTTTGTISRDFTPMDLERIVIRMIVTKMMTLRPRSLTSFFMKVPAIPLHEPLETPTPELKRDFSKDHEDSGDCDFEYSVEESVDNHYRRRFSRSRSRSGHRKIIPKHSSRSRSMERRGHDTHDDKYKIRKRSQSPHKGAGNERRDVTRNSHFLDPKGDLKITISSLVPNYLVPYIIGKNGEVIRSIETKTSCSVSFQKEVKSPFKV